MWRIEEHQRVEKQLDTVPQEILKRYEKWKDIAVLSGPPGLRSSRLGLQYRVIYRLLPKYSLLQVEHVTPHDYRRP
jgi:hypothetical protein